MKKLLSALALALIFCTGAWAQSNIEDTKTVLEKAYSQQPSKDAKKQAKKLEKEGWTTPTGHRPITEQISAANYLELVFLPDDDAYGGKRFIIGSGQGKAKTFSVAQSKARTIAQSTIAQMLKADISSRALIDIDNINDNGDVNTSEVFRQTIESMVSKTLTNLETVVEIYRRLPDNTYEVEITLACDKAKLPDAKQLTE